MNESPVPDAEAVRSHVDALVRDSKTPGIQYLVPLAWVHPAERVPSRAAAPSHAAPRRSHDAAPGWAAPKAAMALDPARAPGERFVERDEGDAPEEGGELRVGGRALHTKYGAGLVRAIDMGDDPIVTVRFAGWGEKRIKASFLRTS